MIKRAELPVEIDFEEASRAWKTNKVAKGNGTYGYKCEKLLRNGTPCSHIALPSLMGSLLGGSDFCKRHKGKI
jgi:hypothetical protein